MNGPAFFYRRGVAQGQTPSILTGYAAQPTTEASLWMYVQVHSHEARP